MSPFGPPLKKSEIAFNGERHPWESISSARIKEVLPAGHLQSKTWHSSGEAALTSQQGETCSQQVLPLARDSATETQLSRLMHTPLMLSLEDLVVLWGPLRSFTMFQRLLQSTDTGFPNHCSHVRLWIYFLMSKTQHTIVHQCLLTPLLPALKIIWSG